MPPAPVCRLVAVRDVTHRMSEHRTPAVRVPDAMASDLASEVTAAERLKSAGMPFVGFVVNKVHGSLPISQNRAQPTQLRREGDLEAAGR